MEFDFEDRAIAGRVTHEICALRAIDEIELDAFDLEIRNVTVDGAVARFESTEYKLKVFLDSALSVEDTASVAIEYSATPQIGLHFRGPDAKHPDRPPHAYTTGLLLEDPMYYYPCYNYPNMRMTSETLLTIPSNMVAVGSGKLISVSEVPGGKSKWHFRMDATHVTDVLTIFVGEYSKIEEKFRDISVEYYFPRGREEDARRTFKDTTKMMEFFSEVTGAEYPYPKYAQVVVADFYNGGMEHVTATTLSDEALHDERAEMDFRSTDLVSHELAHQWFGDMISLKDWSQAWVNEGFATYFNALYREHDQGRDDFLYYMHSFLGRFKEENAKHYERPIVTKLYADSHELFDAHTYLKGAWVLHGIRGILGDEMFWEAMKLYVRDNREKIVESSDFRMAVEEVSGIDFERFFGEWLERPGYPIYEVSHSWSSEERSALLKITQTNADSVPLFSNPIEVKFSLANSSITNMVRMDQKVQTFVFSLPSEPLNVSIDPSNWILKDVRFAKPLGMHLFQLANGENALERIEACEALSGFKEAVLALSERLDSDTFWGVKIHAAKALGKIGTAAAFEILSRKINSDDHRVRRGVAEGLRGFAETDLDERAVELLAGLLENDISYQVRASAAESFGAYKKNEKALKILRGAVEQDSCDDVVRSSAFKALAEAGDAESIGLMLEYFRKGEQHEGRIAAAHAIARLGKGDGRLANELYAARDFADARIRLEAATAIEEMGEREIIGRLSEWLEVEIEGRVRRRIREAIYALNAPQSLQAD